MIKWLLEGDPSIIYQTRRDIMHETDLDKYQNLILTKGWGQKFLALQNPNGHWGAGFYSPKWTSTHYTLMDLISLNVPKTDGIIKAINNIINESLGPDGGVNSSEDIKNSDVCINGMFLNYASYYGLEQEKLKSIVDFIISQKMMDGGFNCRLNRSGAKHSSVHTTINTIEGIERYRREGYTYRLEELVALQRSSEEFLLMHRLYKSDHTGEVINKSMTMLSNPYRWKYNVLRALDYFRFADRPYDERMSDAIELLKSKMKKDGTFPVQSKHPGKFHFEMEKTGKSSRMNTLIAYRVLQYYDKTFDIM